MANSAYLRSQQFGRMDWRLASELRAGFRKPKPSKWPRGDKLRDECQRAHTLPKLQPLLAKHENQQNNGVFVAVRLPRLQLPPLETRRKACGSRAILRGKIVDLTLTVNPRAQTHQPQKRRCLTLKRKNLQRHMPRPPQRKPGNLGLLDIKL